MIGDFLAVPHEVTTTSARVWVGSKVTHPADPSAVWWHEYYDKTRDAYAEAAPATADKNVRPACQGVRPNGVYGTRQRAAAVVE